MDKRKFKQYISTSDFKTLFIREMGWNNPQGQTEFDITIEDITFNFSEIAERNGFQVLTCVVDIIPTASLCKKIDHKLRRMANDYICIYYITNTENHEWVVPVKKIEKRDLVLVDYTSADQAEFLYDKMSRISFELDERTTIMDVKERIQEGFIINSERITKEFYNGFKKEHTKFVQFITGLDDQITDLKKNRKKQWYTSVMLNRLMFCYFIQKKEFLNLDKDYLRTKLDWVKAEKGEDRFYGSFYKGFLMSLFHEGLNSPRHQPGFEQKYGRIPYLNGGMFSVHELEEEFPDIDIADEAFESLFDFFDQWRWHLDDRITASGKDINPDVLGYIFEQYINQRAEMGAYYTKEDITEYIGRNTILPYLMDATKKAYPEAFEKTGEVWTALRQSGDQYIFDAVKKGKGLEIPEEIAIGIDTSKPNLMERRSHWNEKTAEKYALPTEIWRETIERLRRYNSIKAKIENGEIAEVNDFITYNLDIRQFVQDILVDTNNKLLIKQFYTQLRKVTILDPTCGSGAFLFAALNILEPLYEVCIERMQDWKEKGENIFDEELSEISGKFRSNIRYFIYKNIILRNLYGVDIMAEATEIAKLRLFLKMVAVVDVNPRDPNLGLDPLPDIDFNIRCGNTLVGYATKDQMLEDLKFGDMFAKQEFEDKVKAEMSLVAKAYSIFKDVQLDLYVDLDTFRDAKKELKERLKSLNDLLNKKLYTSTADDAKNFGGLGYDAWQISHQPFHWLAEYYDIINGKGGFDVIIGNPPYVSMSNIIYLKNTKEFNCSDLYGHVINRVLFLLNNLGRHGFIVMHNLAFSRNFTNVRKVLMDYKGCKWFSFYSRIPSGLFSGDVRVRNCIYLLSSSGNITMTSRLHRWFSEQRDILFNSEIEYVNFDYSDCIPMLHSAYMQQIYEKTKGVHLSQLVRQDGRQMYFKKVGYNFLSVSSINPPAYDIDKNKIEQTGTEMIKIDKDYFEMVLLLLCGKFYLTKWLTYGDDFHLTNRDLLSFSYPFDSINKEDRIILHDCFNKLIVNIPNTIQYKLNAGINVGTYNTAALWDITNISDGIFLKYISNNSDIIIDQIESHLSKCVISNKI